MERAYKDNTGSRWRHGLVPMYVDVRETGLKVGQRNTSKQINLS
jgi:hypothetical protein